jgi:hypothetical protein
MELYMGQETDKQSVVEKLTDALNIFGKADVAISFESETQLIIKVVSAFFENIDPTIRIDLVSNAIKDLENTELKGFSILILPFTEDESKKD